MPTVTIHTKPTCPYCIAAKTLLRRKGIGFDEVNIEGDREAAAALIQRTGRRTVPQIFIGETHVGGYDDLHALDITGRLDELLAGVA